MCLKSKINSKNLEKYIYALSFRGKSILILKLVSEDKNKYRYVRLHDHCRNFIMEN